MKQGAINGHEPIAPKESTGHAGPLGDQLTALAHEDLQALAAQCLASSTQSPVTYRARRLARMEIAELAYQLLPHLALVQTAPQRHPDHQQHQGQGRAQPHPLGVHLTQHRHAHLFTHLVIDIHLA